MNKENGKNIRNNYDNDRANRDYFGYFIIVVMVFLLYLFSFKFSFLYHKVNVPRGDPFSYSVGFFSLLDQLHANFLQTFFSLFAGRNWYWLLNIAITIFSPILVKEAYSIALVNFVLFGFATAAIFRLARCLNYNMAFAFLLSLTLWVFPSNYGFLHPVSLLQMQLDTAFLFAVVIASANILIYSLSLDKSKNAFWAGVSIGFAVWGRGNSLPYVLICVFFPLINIVLELLRTKGQNKKRKKIINFAVFSLIILFMSGAFYLLNWAALSGYYSVHSSVIKHQTAINFSGILIYLKEIPGRFFTFKGPFLPFTIGAHIIALLSFCGVLMLNRRNTDLNNKSLLKMISFTGVITFYGVLVFNLMFFNDPNFFALHNYALMLVGLVLCAFSLFASFAELCKRKKLFRLNETSIIITLCFCAIFYGRYFTKKNTPLDFDLSAATPREIEIFACGLDKFLAGRSLAVLWYEMYNAPIINYYRIKNGLSSISFYTNDFYKDLWIPPYSVANNARVLEGIKKTFAEADFVIIPEFSDSYFKHEPYPLYHSSDDLAKYLNSPESPRFVVRKVLHEPGNIRLLLIQKKTDTLSDRGDFVPLKLPYGPSNSQGKSAYSFVPSDKFEESAQLCKIEVSAETGTNNYERAFDHSIVPNSFWEVSGQYPFWIRFEYGIDTKISRYFLQSGELAERMPVEWQLQGSMNDKDWAVVDKITLESKWKVNEKKEFTVSVPQSYKYYRLYFTAGEHPAILRIYELGLIIDKQIGSPNILNNAPVLSENPAIRVSAQTGTHSYEKAFDYSVLPDDFWEVGGKYPFWISFEYGKKIKFLKYFLQTGEFAERMPTEWQFQGSNDDKNWEILDRRPGIKEWKSNQKREFIVSNPGEYRFYRLYFTAGGELNTMRIYEIGLLE